MLQQRTKISKLSKDVADKIAAGEVVDRPLSVVKELLENAIDAGADSIVAEIRNGGKTYIRITDNGCGIPSDELLTAFDRHATSKITSASDLNTIRTLGFRGEALASIAAVSEIEVITKIREESAGAKLLMAGGQIVEQSKTGAPDGTTIIVSNLFYNTPARKKFLKSDSAESGMILDFLSKMAIAYPHIRLRVINNGANLFTTQGNGNVYANILTVYSRELGEHLIPVEREEGIFRLEAFLSPPSYSRTSRKQQIVFVNGRAIKSKVLDEAIEEAYRQRLPEGRHPVAVLFLQIDPEHLDVNIHPNKKEVRFDDNAAVSAFVKDAFVKALATERAVPEIKKEPAFRRKEIPENLTVKPEQETLVDIKYLLSTKREETIAEPKTPTYEEHPFDFSQITIFGSVFGTYITAVDETSFYLIDQHAAHERVYYEKLLEAYEKSEKSSQMLLAPIIKEVPAVIAAEPEGIVTELSRFGFETEVFGKKSFIIKAVPAFMTHEEAMEFLETCFDIAERPEDFRDRRKLDRIIMDSCKSAVKGNQKLSIPEMEHLLDDLSKTKNPFSCPHGRPTFVKLTRNGIEKLFKRV